MSNNEKIIHFKINLNGILEDKIRKLKIFKNEKDEQVKGKNLYIKKINNKL